MQLSEINNIVIEQLGHFGFDYKYKSNLGLFCDVKQINYCDY